MHQHHNRHRLQYAPWSLVESSARLASPLPTRVQPSSRKTPRRMSYPHRITNGLLIVKALPSVPQFVLGCSVQSSVVYAHSSVLCLRVKTLNGETNLTLELLETP